MDDAREKPNNKQMVTGFTDSGAQKQKGGATQ